MTQQRCHAALPGVTASTDNPEGVCSQQSSIDDVTVAAAAGEPQCEQRGPGLGTCRVLPEHSLTGGDLPARACTHGGCPAGMEKSRSGELGECQFMGSGKVQCCCPACSQRSGRHAVSAERSKPHDSTNPACYSARRRQRSNYPTNDSARHWVDMPKCARRLPLRMSWLESGGKILEWR